ncbi:uncharacterized protein EV420DRAFT_1635801 [Desarmillaria tabescens]|uniref:Mid2 domain-containing protein n=1 Tax=Armillaria tabescens TaxID=1929756 RepID=A0AA39NJE8_ARMTA|nr:uncharacterized protein EV420DRAFT_1635801 [Desarmillaria tabescens]KAK0466758.1 hypothetical protein EV420DRAFT_1635801 [Desarmillaria tabescens]
MLLLFVLCILCTAQAVSFHNVSIPNNASQIVYTPFFCDFTEGGGDCKGGWQAVDVDGTTVISTDGLDEEGAAIIPQMFLQIHAAALFVTTSSQSNATINITVSAGNTSIEQQFQPPLSTVTVVNLIEDEVTTFSITFINGTRLDVGTLTAQVSDGSSETVLPMQTLPPAIIIPSSTTILATPTGVASAGGSVNNSKRLALALGLTLGLGLGLTLVSIAAYLVWERSKTKDKDLEKTETRSIFQLLRTHKQGDSSWF